MKPESLTHRSCGPWRPLPGVERAWVLAFLWTIGTATWSSAGEAIQFSKEKPSTGPELETRGTKEKLSSLARKRVLDSAEPVDLSAAAGNYVIGPMRRNRKEEKKLENAKKEKANWMILDRGELQEKDEQKSEFGVRDYSGEGIEKEKTTGEIWFGPKQDRAARASAQPGSAASRDAATPRPAPKAESEDSSAEINLGKGSKDQDRMLLSGPKEVELRTILNTGEPNDSFSSKPLAPGDDRSRRRDEFGLRSSDTSLSSPNLGLSLGKGLGFGRDPVVSGPGLLDGPSRSPLSGPANSRLGSLEFLGPPASGFSSPAGSGFNNNNTLPRTDFAPGSIRPAFGGR